MRRMSHRVATALGAGVRAARTVWRAPAAPTRATSAPSTRGDSGRRRSSTPGTPYLAGRIAYETDFDLQGAGFATECERMLRQSCKVSMVHNRLVDAACSATLRWEPGRDTAAAKRNAHHMNGDFGLGQFETGWLRRGLGPIRRETLGFGGIGWRYGETAVEFGVDGLWHVVDVHDCCPTAHAQNGWQTAHNGELRRILQANVYGQSGYIDADWAVLWTLNGSGNNFEGRGLLRPCVPWFKMVGLAYEMLGIATEKYAVGVPKASIDRRAGAGVYQDADFDDVIDRYIEVMTQYAAGEASWLLDSPEFRTEIIGQDAFNPERIVAVLRFAYEQILSAYLLNMLELGTSGTGSYNVGQVLQDAFTQLVVRVLDTWCDAFSGRPRPGGGSVLRVLDLSYGPQHPNDYPRLKHYGVAEDPFADLLKHLPNLLQPAVNVARFPVIWDRIMRLVDIDPEDGRETLAQLAKLTPPGGAAPVSSKDYDPASGGVPRKVVG